MEIVHYNISASSLQVNSSCDLILTKFRFAKDFNDDRKDLPWAIEDKKSILLRKIFFDAMIKLQRLTFGPLIIFLEKCFEEENALFPRGGDDIEQIVNIMNRHSKLSDEELFFISFRQIEDRIKKMAEANCTEFRSIFRKANPSTLKLLEKLSPSTQNIAFHLQMHSNNLFFLEIELEPSSASGALFGFERAPNITADTIGEELKKEFAEFA